jgi:hypothetical protein
MWIKRRHLTETPPLMDNNLGRCPLEMDRLPLRHSNLNLQPTNPSNQ